MELLLNMEYGVSGMALEVHKFTCFSGGVKA